MTRFLAVAICSTCLLPLKAATLVNGSFEDLGAPSYIVNATTDSMSAVAPDGWTISANTPDWFLGAPGAPSGLWNTPWGDLFVVGAAEGAGYREGISQSISGLTIGQVYLIEFQQANGLLFDQVEYQGIGTVGGWEVRIDGSPVLLSNSVNDNSVPAPAFTTDWGPASVSFEATATSQTLEFLAFGGTAGNETYQFLDEVTINAIPEPASGLLAALGSVALLRRRRPSAA
jgi:hypothetical protein